MKLSEKVRLFRYLLKLLTMIPTNISENPFMGFAEILLDSEVIFGFSVLISVTIIDLVVSVKLGFSISSIYFLVALILG